MKEHSSKKTEIVPLTENIIEAIKDCIIVTDPQGNMQFVNLSVINLTGYSRKELLGHNLTLIMPEVLAIDKVPLDKGPQESTQPKTWGILETKNKEEIPIHCNYGLIRNNDGNIVSVVYVAKDIREYKQTEEELIRSYQNLKQTQDELILNEKMAAIGRLATGMAHEIRNPLAVLTQGMHLLENLITNQGKGISIEELKETFAILNSSVIRIDNIVNHLLGYSRIPTINFIPNKVCEMIEEGLSVVAKRIIEAKIKIEKKYPKEDIVIKSEKVIFSQVFVNLATNALDALGPEGAISIEVERVKGTCLIRFSDNGQGIDARDLPNIFEPFYSTKQYGQGTGLGLTMVHLIVERHKGIVSVESEINKGTTFTIKIPIA